MSKGEKGLVHLYTGEGKGKTTAAMGLALRAVGAGKRVAVCQFLKSGDSHELAPLQKLGVAVHSPQNGNLFIWQMGAEERAEYNKAQAAILQKAKSLVEECDLLVLDEAAAAADCGAIAEEDLLQFIQEKPEGLELVLTGRSTSGALRGAADYVTVMENQKHPFAKGVPAREGIEY